VTTQVVTATRRQLGGWDFFGTYPGLSSSHPPETFAASVGARSTQGVSAGEASKPLAIAT
jgi:hypothetical protein